MNKFKNKWIFIVAIIVIILGTVIYFNRDEVSKLIRINSKNLYDSISTITNNNKEKISCINNKPNLLWALEYNDTVSSGTDGYCIAGTEDTCKASTCYEDKSVGSCEAGTIILYRVNNDEIYYFNVLHDDGDTMTLQSENAIVKSVWNESNNCIEGPVTALTNLTEATKDWSNVNDLTYTLGETVFLKYPNDSNNNNPYTKCDSYNDCKKNIYTLSSELTTNVKARMITVQEAADVGADSTYPNTTSPRWIFNIDNSNIATVNIYSARNEECSGIYVIDSLYKLIDSGTAYNINKATYSINAVVEINK